MQEHEHKWELSKTGREYVCDCGASRPNVVPKIPSEMTASPSVPTRFEAVETMRDLESKGRVSTPDAKGHRQVLDKKVGKEDVVPVRTFTVTRVVEADNIDTYCQLVNQARREVPEWHFNGPMIVVWNPELKKMCFYRELIQRGKEKDNESTK